MIISGHQPNYLPNLSFFAKMQEVDLFVVVSNVQLQRDKGWQRRNRIRNRQNDTWLSVPVKGDIHQMIRDTRINNEVSWREHHKATLQTVYGRQCGADLLPELLKIYDQPWERLVDLNWAIILHMRSLLGISTPCILDEEVSGEREQLVINVCKKYGGDVYIAGVGGHLYIDDDYLNSIAKAGVTFRYMQRDLNKDFPYSAIHYLLMHGAEWTRTQLNAYE